MPGTPLANVYDQIQRRKLDKKTAEQDYQIAQANAATYRGYLDQQRAQLAFDMKKNAAQQEANRLKQHESAFEGLRAAAATNNPELIQAAQERLYRLGLRVDEEQQPVGRISSDFKDYEGPTYLDPETLQVIPQNPEELWADVNDPSVLDDETEYEIRRVPQESGPEKIQVRPKLLADPSAPKGMVVRDPDSGKVLMTVAPNRLEQRQTRIGSAAELLPEAQKVMEAGMAAGLSDADALEIGIKAHEKILDRQAREKRTRIGSGQAVGGGSGGYATVGKSDEIGNIDTNFNRWIDSLAFRYGSTHGVKEKASWLQQGAELLKMFNSPDAQSQNEGVNRLIKLAQGSRPSDADRSFALRSTGALNDLGRQILQWAPGRKGGTLPRDQLAQLKRYALLMMKAQEEIVNSVAENMMGTILNNPMIQKMSPEDQVKWARYAAEVASGFPAKMPSLPGAPAATPAPSAPSKKAAPENADAAADDIMGGE